MTSARLAVPSTPFPISAAGVAYDKGTCIPQADRLTGVRERNGNETSYPWVSERAVQSNLVLTGIVALTTAVVPNGVSCLVSRHAPIGTCNINSEL